MSMPRATSRAFSLVEMIVVVVLLVVLAAVTVPRVAGSGDRRARAEVDAVASLLTQAARRQALSMQRVAVEHDGARARVAVVVLRGGEAEREARGMGAAEWQSDPLLPPVWLRWTEVVWAGNDTGVLEPRRFHVELGGPGSRGSLMLVLRQRGGDGLWTVRLLPTADRAQVVEGESGTRPWAGDPDTVDLDLAGRRDSPW